MFPHATLIARLQPLKVDNTAIDPLLEAIFGAVQKGYSRARLEGARVVTEESDLVENFDIDDVEALEIQEDCSWVVVWTQGAQERFARKNGAGPSPAAGNGSMTSPRTPLTKPGLYSPGISGASASMRDVVDLISDSEEEEQQPAGASTPAEKLPSQPQRESRAEPPQTPADALDDNSTSPSSISYPGYNDRIQRSNANGGAAGSSASAFHPPNNTTPHSAVISIIDSDEEDYFESEESEPNTR